MEYDLISIQIWYKLPFNAYDYFHRWQDAWKTIHVTERLTFGFTLFGHSLSEIRTCPGFTLLNLEPETYTVDDWSLQ